MSAARQRAAAGRTAGELRREIAGALRAGGIETPELDARVLMQAALGCDHAALAAAPERRLTAPERARIGALAARRLRREPVARIVGEKEFWGLPLRVGAATLIPRPETETVVEAALAMLGRAAQARPLRVLDIGTGSGALLIALLRELPNAQGVGTDISMPALRIARDNAARHGVVHRALYVRTDLAGGLAGGLDLIVCNPPYIRSEAIAGLAPEVRDYEPRRALDGGADGLAFYRRLAAALPALLAPGGMLLVEVGFDQAEPVARIFSACGLRPLRPPATDLSGIPRVAIFGAAGAEKPPQF